MPALTQHRTRGCAHARPAAGARPLPARQPAYGKAAAGEEPLPAAGMRLAGRYRLDHRIGGPDWSSEWMGTDELLGRPVTVRVFRSGPVPDVVMAAVRNAGRLTDPRLARIYDSGDEAGRPYLVSECAPGTSLGDLLASDLPSPALAVTITAQAAAALAVAHAAGQPHLCLSPELVRWNSDGVKITGLGIEAALRGMLPGVTAAQAAAADTRALAGVLYALLTGYWPGDEATSLPPAPRHRGLVHLPGQIRPGVPAILDEIICRALLPGTSMQEQITTPGQLAHALNSVRGLRLHPVPLPERASGPARRPSSAPAASAASARPARPARRPSLAPAA